MLIPLRPNHFTTRGVRLPTDPAPLTASPSLIEFWLRLCLGGSSSGNGVQHVSCPSMETFGSVTKGVVPVQVAPSRRPLGPLRSLCSIAAAPLLLWENTPHKMTVMKGKIWHTAYQVNSSTSIFSAPCSCNYTLYVFSSTLKSCFISCTL